MLAPARYLKYIGIGIYSIPEAARLVGAPYQNVKRWIGDVHGFEGLIERSSPVQNTVNFTELMELLFVSMFRAEGVSLQTIRKASKAAAKRFHSKHPLAVKRFDTDGRDIFVTLQKKETDEQQVEDLAKGQLVFETIITPFFRKVEYGHTQEALRYWPLEPSGRIVLDPERRFGQPIDAETGVPADAIISALEAGGGQDAAEVAAWFDIPLEAVRAAITFNRSLAV